MSDEGEEKEVVEEEPKSKKKPKLRGWIGRKAGAEEVADSADEKIAKAVKEQSEE